MMPQIEVPKLWTPGRRNDRRVRCAPPPPPPPAGFGVPLQGQNYIVPPIPGLSFWFDARSVTTSGGNVVTWPNIINPAQPITVATGTLAYNAMTAGLNGFPSIQCGSGYMGSAAISLAMPDTIFAVILSGSSVAGSQFAWDGGSLGTGRQPTYGNGISTLYVASQGATQAAFSLVANTAYAVVQVTSSSSVIGYVNASGSPVTASGSTQQNLVGLTIGGRYSLTMPWLGTIAAIAGMAGTPTTAQVSAWFRYYAFLTGNGWS
jgi:hypothetical protein